MESLGALTNSKNSLKLLQDDSDRASNLGIPINTVSGDRIQINNKIYDLTPEMYKALSNTGYTDKTMKNENDISMMNNIIRDLGYRGDGDRDWKRRIFFTTFPQLAEETKIKTFDEITDDCDNLQGEGVKIVIPFIIFDIYTRLEIILGLKLSVHNDTLTEASNLIDEVYNRGETQNKQQYRNAPNKFQT